MKSPLNFKINLAGMTFFLLVGTSLLGFSSLIPRAAASPIDNNATTTGAAAIPATTMSGSSTSSLNAATATAITPTIELGEEPFAVGRYTPVSQTMINETQQLKIIFEGSTTITLSNSTEPITTRDKGESIITFLPGGGGGINRGQIQLTTEDGSETVIADVTEYFLTESPTTISLVYFSTNSTGLLAPLNNMIAVSLGEQQPNGDIIARGFEWKGNSSGGEHTHR